MWNHHVFAKLGKLDWADAGGVVRMLLSASRVSGRPVQRSCLGIKCEGDSGAAGHVSITLVNRDPHR